LLRCRLLLIALRGRATLFVIPRLQDGLLLVSRLGLLDTHRLLFFKRILISTGRRRR
jgi:hypothetical protein